MTWVLFILKSAIKALLLIGVMSIWAVLALGMWVMTDDAVQRTSSDETP